MNMMGSSGPVYLLRKCPITGAAASEGYTGVLNYL